ncbi:hypothetical protein B0A48_17656 [Cryoendolithus antarcticus]|uniref:Uncharacterized protein n=1 Tax=Cryoendolithus antarcticus TaxID=1507870 RepID=A0A1V8SB16_9PEZI|nr:hypothetical protein B0A48_17656 [Cryoendolithus antarcticus]
MQYSPFRAPTLDRHLYALRSRLEHDRTRLETQYHEASDLQRHLSNLETDLYEVTTKFMDAALDLAQLTLGGTAPADNTTYEPTLELSAPSTMSSLTRLDPLLAQYYDRAGDVSIMAERMGDLQEQHYHEIATRGLREDQAEVLSIADADFDDNYEREHRILQTELDIAAGEADELRARCEAAGLDISAGLRNTEDSDTDVEDSDLKPSNELIAPTPSGPTHDVEGMLHLLDIKDAAEQVRTASSVLRAPLKPSESDDRTVISVDDWIASVTSSLNVDETNYTGFPGDPRSLPARSRNPSLSTLGTPLARRHSETDLLDEVLHGAGYGASGTSPPKPPDRSSLAI